MIVDLAVKLCDGGSSKEMIVFDQQLMKPS